LSAFESGLCWTLYKYMESDFSHFMEYVPYTGDNALVYSPKLLALLLQICGYIDTVFKEMAKFQEFENIPECQKVNALAKKDYKGFDIRLAQLAFEKIYKLSSNNGAKIVAKLDWYGDKELTPFSTFSRTKNVSPYWWKIHQGIKHSWTTAIHEANMYNTLEALSGAFLLNAVHYPSVSLLWRLRKFKTVWKTSSGLKELSFTKRHFDETLQRAVSSLEAFQHAHIIETPLFVYTRT
jgi:hypothetical protein